MTVSAAYLVKDPPLDRLAALAALLRPVVSQSVYVVDDRTAAGTVETLSRWERAEVVPYSWRDDFSDARNAGLERCTGDWTLVLDPDELPSLAMMEFIRMVDAGPWGDTEWQGRRVVSPRGYLFFTENWEDGVQGPEWEEHWHCRLFRTGRGRFYKPVHEQVRLEGLPEESTRGTVLLPKAPRSAVLVHSKLSDAAPASTELYVKIGAKS